MKNKGVPHFFLWGFDNDGDIFVDARLSLVKQDQSEIEALKMMDLRLRCNPSLNSSMLWLPRGESFEGIVFYVEMYNLTQDKSVLKKLKDARVKVTDLIRKKEANNALDFILHCDD